jgi:hypothetical protein
MCPANNNTFHCYSREKVVFGKKVVGRLLFLIKYVFRLEFVFSDGEQIYMDSKVGLFMTSDEVAFLVCSKYIS